MRVDALGCACRVNARTRHRVAGRLAGGRARSHNRFKSQRVERATPGHAYDIDLAGQRDFQRQDSFVHDFETGCIETDSQGWCRMRPGSRPGRSAVRLGVSSLCGVARAGLRARPVLVEMGFRNGPFRSWNAIWRVLCADNPCMHDMRARFVATYRHDCVGHSNAHATCVLIVENRIAGRRACKHDARKSSRCCYDRHGMGRRAHASHSMTPRRPRPGIVRP